jgi:hypothetical protein
MYRNDDKYHHGPFNGPNRHRLDALRNIVAVIGKKLFIYYCYYYYYYYYCYYNFELNLTII